MKKVKQDFLHIMVLILEHFLIFLIKIMINQNFNFTLHLESPRTMVEN